MPLDLCLVGLGHYDLKGPERLQKLLPRISADLVSIEYNPQAVIHLNQLERAKKSPQGMQELIDHWCRKGYPSENVRQLIPILDFEFFVSKEYCKKWNKPLLFSDLGDASISQRSFHYAMSAPLPITQQQTERTYQSLILPVPPEEVPNLMKRDEYTETILRALSWKVVHVVGAWHLFGDYHNLYERLRDLNPTRIMLNQADYI